MRSIDGDGELVRDPAAVHLRLPLDEGDKVEQPHQLGDVASRRPSSGAPARRTVPMLPPRKHIAQPRALPDVDHGAVHLHGVLRAFLGMDLKLPLVLLT